MKSKKEVLNKLKKKLVEVIKIDVRNDLVAGLMKKYDEEIVSMEDEDDPMRPSLCREEFKEFLERSVEDSIEITSDGIKFGIGDTERLGLEEELSDETTDCLKIIGTILNGIVGRYVLVFAEEVGQPVGRTGRAFLLTREDFDKKSKMFGWQQRPDWRFSNFSGIKNFWDVELNMDKYIEKAIKGLK